MLAEFENSPIFTDKAIAFLAADKLYEEQSEMYPVEYGIRIIKSTRTLTREVLHGR